MNKQEVLTFLKTKDHMVISSISENAIPEAALIGFGQTENLELIFGTHNTSRKYKNLKANPKAAFVIGFGEEGVTVQYEGIARELSKEEVEKYITLYFTKIPSAKAYRNNPHQSYWLVKPIWIRYSDLSGDTPKIEEMTF